jgi:hypothetical protein
MSELVKIKLTKENAPGQFAIIQDRNREIASAVQKHLFHEFDAVWAFGGPLVKYLEEEVLYVSPSSDGGYVLAYSTLDYYNTGDRRERFPEMSIEVEAVYTVSIYNNVRAVKIGGKMYNESDIIQILKSNPLTIPEIA